MNDRVSGPLVMAAFGEAIDDGASRLKLAIFYLGVSAGQCFSQGWKPEDLETEISNLAISHPTLARNIRKQLSALTPQGCHGSTEAEG